MLNEDRTKENFMVACVVLFFIFMGFLGGYACRSFMTHDRYLRATADRFFATAAYYEEEAISLKEKK
ncbi:MAG: hypothetical protein HGA87_01045 [Desulfobulbaceae bacterium]|nr:hypothetical protein [Desulfobulbaceae bacterium]